MIDTEEIVGILRNAQAEVEWEYPMDYAAAIDKAIEALYVEDDLIKIEMMLAHSLAAFYGGPEIRRA